MQSLIHKIVIFGVPHPESLKLSQIQSNKVEVCLLQQIPESSVQINYEMWAYPDGIKIYDHLYQIINDEEPQFSFDSVPSYKGDRLPNSSPPDYIYSFVLTDYELNRTYCSCLSWNEKHFIVNDTIDSKIQKSKNLPKCQLSILVDNPLALDSNVSMVYIPKTLILNSKIPCFGYQRTLLTEYYERVLKQSTVSIPKSLLSSLTKLINRYGYSQAQSIFDSKLYRQSEKEDQQKCLKVKKKKLKQFYLSSMFLLPQSKRMLILSENERIMGTSFLPDLPFRIPVIYEPHQLLEDDFNLFPVSSKLIIALWKCLLLERQILIFSHSQALTIKVCQFSLYLLSPIIWENIYIPFLPFHLSHHVDAIGGYLIGMSHIHMDYMLENFDMKSKVILDLKNGTLIEDEDDIMSLPVQVEKYLTSQLAELQKQKQQEMKKPSIFSATSILSSYSKQKVSLLSIHVDEIVKVKKIFFNSLMLMLNNFIPFISQKQNIVCFRLQEFLSIIPDEDHRKFMKQMSRTMIFIRLCEYHVRQSKSYAWVQKNAGELLFYCHDILKPFFEGNNTPFSWKLSDLTNENSKYCKYISYLQEKCSKEIKENLEALKLYLNMNKNKVTEKNTTKSRWKKFGEKDSDDLMQQADKLIQNFKIEKYLTKYIKYVELNNPHRLIYRYKQKKQEEGWISWFMGLVQAPKSIKQEQRYERKQKIKKEKRKNYEKREEIADLNHLFSYMKNSEIEGQQKDQESKNKLGIIEKKRVSQCRSQIIPLRKRQIL